MVNHSRSTKRVEAEKSKVFDSAKTSESEDFFEDGSLVEVAEFARADADEFPAGGFSCADGAGSPDFAPGSYAVEIAVAPVMSAEGTEADEGLATLYSERLIFDESILALCESLAWRTKWRNSCRYRSTQVATGKSLSVIDFWLSVSPNTEFVVTGAEKARWDFSHWLRRWRSSKSGTGRLESRLAL